MMRGPKPGDRFSVLHSDGNHGTVLGVLTAEKVTRLNDRRSFRITSTRSDGTPIEFTVDTSGRDQHGYVEPVD